MITTIKILLEQYNTLNSALLINDQRNELFTAKEYSAVRKQLNILKQLLGDMAGDKNTNSNWIDKNIQISEELGHELDEVLTLLKNKNDPQLNYLTLVFKNLLGLIINENTLVKTCQDFNLDEAETAHARHLQLGHSDKSESSQYVASATQVLETLKKIKGVQNYLSIDLKSMLPRAENISYFFVDIFTMTRGKGYSTLHQKLLPELADAYNFLERINDELLDDERKLIISVSNVISPAFQQILESQQMFTEAVNNFEALKGEGFELAKSQVRLDAAIPALQENFAQRTKNANDAINKIQQTLRWAGRIKNPDEALRYAKTDHDLDLTTGSIKDKLTAIENHILTARPVIAGPGSKYIYKNTTYKLPMHMKQMMDILHSPENQAGSDEELANKLIAKAKQAAAYRPSFIHAFFYRRDPSVQNFYDTVAAMKIDSQKDESNVEATPSKSY